MALEFDTPTAMWVTPGFGKLAVTNSDFSIYIGRLSFFRIYHYCAVVKRI
jgi:hypothetical protein